MMRHFDTFMTVEREGSRPSFADIFPLDTQLVDGFQEQDKEAVILVDVGGGQGQEIMELRKRYPKLPGRTVLQDLPHVIAGAPKTDGMEIMEYDFFTPQPIKGKQVND